MIVDILNVSNGSTNPEDVQQLQQSYLAESELGTQLCIQIYAPKLGRIIDSIIPLQTFNQVHVLLGQLKVENLEILFQSLKF